MVNTLNNGIKILQKYYEGKSTFAYVRFAGTTAGKPILGDISEAGDARFEFVGANNDGYITTYGIRSGGGFWKTINGNPSLNVINPYSQINVQVAPVEIYATQENY